jgi:hypothetical protein
MKSESRRLERNPSIIKRLRGRYPEIISFVESETQSQVLEGTGKISLEFQVKIFSRSLGT